MHSLASTSGRAAAVSHTHRQATALQGMAHQGWHAPAPAGASGVLQRSSAHALLPQQQQRPWRSQGRRALQLLRATGLEEADTATTSTPPTPASPPPATPPPESTSSTSSSTSTSSPAKIQRTLMDLDAILGIQPDAPPATSSKGTQTIDALSKLTGDAAPAQSAAGAADAKAGSPPQDKVEEQVQRIVEKARKMANEQGKGAPMEAEQQQLRQEFESLLQNMNSPAALDKETIKKIKDAAFGPQTFFVTETQQLTQADRTGLLVRGNLRDERDKVYEHVRAKVAELFGDKYTVIMVEDEQAMLEAGAGVGGLGGAAGPGTSSGPRQSGAASRAQELNTPRIAFQIVPTAQATPPQPNGWKGVVAVGLLLLFLGSCGQLALAANITKLPRETLEWFANPANFESDQLPPGLENWDPTSYFSTAAPIFGAVISSNLAHEIGHRMAAAWQGVKVGPSYFIPNFQIGSFGAITPITTLLKNRTQLWDVAAAGPLAGLIFSALLLAIGLSQSQTGALPADALVPVPTPLFQGSLLLGGLAKLALGDALHASEVPVSPLVVAGWCGLISQALQLLPVGSVDGGRMVQGAFGKGTLALTSFFTYAGLGLGLLGSSLALPYGLYVLICLRDSERYVADNVTPPSNARANATWALIVLAVLMLVPMAPELADSWGVGPGRDAFFLN